MLFFDNINEMKKTIRQGSRMVSDKKY